MLGRRDPQQHCLGPGQSAHQVIRHHGGELKFNPIAVNAIDYNMGLLWKLPLILEHLLQAFDVSICQLDQIFDRQPASSPNAHWRIVKSHLYAKPNVWYSPRNWQDPKTSYARYMPELYSVTDQ